MKLLSNYCLILAFIAGALLVQSHPDRFEPSATTPDGRQRELREQVRYILRQNDQEDLLSRLDDAIIDEAFDRVADEALDRAADGYDYHDQTQNAAIFLTENAHQIDHDDAAGNSNCNNNNNNEEDHDNDVSGGDNNNQHHDNNLQNALNMDNDGECEEY